MPRPNRSADRRRALIPIVARTFAQRGYRRATTAELARCCGVRENILYRLWPDKKAMFIASIRYVYELSARVWEGLLRGGRDGSTAAQRLLEYESRHHGEFGHYRIVFAGLSETDDPQIRAALAEMYRRYQRFIERQIAAQRGNARTAADRPAARAAWAIIGLGTVTDIARELGLLGEAGRRRLMRRVGAALLDTAAPPSEC